MTYIENLVDNGTNFQVRRGEGTASFTPVSGRDEDIEAFKAWCATFVDTRETATRSISTT